MAKLATAAQWSLDRNVNLDEHYYGQTLQAAEHLVAIKVSRQPVQKHRYSTNLARKMKRQQ
jgi:hypothetical protein